MLEEYRKEIDFIDDDIISLLSKRNKVVEKIGNLKIKNNLPVYQAGRWDIVIEQAIKKGKKLGLSPSFIRNIWKTIHNHSLYIQYQKKGTYSKLNLPK